ncbi:19975_t:CDS:2, partial [Cetraspora pellucida]
MERQEALEVMVTQLINDIKTLQSSYQKLKIKENDCECDNVCWCLENLDTMMEKEEKTYLQMVAKKYDNTERNQDDNSNVSD